MLSSCVRPSVRLSVTSRRCTKTAKSRITQTTPYDSPRSLVFWCQRPRRNSNWVTPNRGAKLRCGRLQSAIFDQDLAISQKRPPPRGKTRILGTVLNFDRTYLYNGTWHQQSERNLPIYRDSLYAPKFGKLWSRNGWERLASFAHPLNFRIGRHCQPYRMHVI